MTPPDRAFRRVQAFHDVSGLTRIEWELDYRFRDRPPHTFQLEVATTRGAEAGAWTPVGPPADDVFYLVDDEKREWGKTFDHAWRVRLATADGAYTSPVVTALDGLEHRDWRLAREILRQVRLEMRAYTGVAGALLKRRRYGTPCQTCLDPETQEPTRSDCPECQGTGTTTGYHPAVVGLDATLGLESSREERDGAATAGTVKPVVVQATFAGYPLTAVDARDVFAERKSGRRWFVQRVLKTAELRGYPIVLNVELRLAPFSDVVYDLPIPW